MKRIDLLRLISAAARERGVPWDFVREGGEHEVWDPNGRRVTIPRHREIREQLARKILTSTEQELGPRWWKG